MKILITGATGLVGTEIVKQSLAKNYTVHYLTTRRTKIANEKKYKGFYWNPALQEIDTNCLNGVDVIINLAGASISKKWTNTHKKAVLNSRIDSLRLLHRLLSENTHTVKQLCSASALGIYPSSFTKKYDESDKETSSSFLGEVVESWENEVDSFQPLNLKITKIRIGIVLSKNGGAITEMVKPVKLGAAAALGSGKQWQSWIHVTDLANLFLFSVEKKLAGIYNGVGSNPVTNNEMTKEMAKQLEKPFILPNVPAFMMKLILGEMSAIVLESQYLKNDKIKNEGFEFEYTSIKDALKECLS
jgi:uncharacterized protein (TIGR01777 family)